MSSTETNVATVIIEPPRRAVQLDLAELWSYRELLWTLAIRDIKVRYKQTEFGAAWAIIQPVFTMIVFSIVFGRLAGFASETQGVPYPIFTYVAVLPWIFFSGSVTAASGSLVDSSNLITKVYFPRLVIPLSTIASGLLDFAVASVVLIGMFIYYRMAFTVTMLAAPLLVILVAFAAMGVSMWLGALNVKYRDIRYVIPFLMQVWMYLTPIAYPASAVPDRWKTLYALNPMVGVIEGFRWSLLAGHPFPGAALAVSVVTVALVCIGGLYYFRRMERTFADVV